MKYNRDQVNPPQEVGSTSIIDDVNTDQNGFIDVVHRDRTTSVKLRKKNSFLGSVLAFVVPFVIVSFFVGVFRNQHTQLFSIASSAQDDEIKTTLTKSPMLEKVADQSLDVSDSFTPSHIENEEQQGKTSIQELQTIEIEPGAPTNNDLTESGSELSIESPLQDNQDVDELIEEKEEAPSPYDAPEETSQALAQLEYQFLEIRKNDVRDPDILLSVLSPLRERANVISERAVPELVEQARTVLKKIQSFQEMLAQNRDFFIQLEQFDQASLDPADSRVFFDRFQTLENVDEVASEITAYRNDFTKVANRLDQLETVERWNGFVEQYGESLERFHVSQDAARKAIEFVSQHESLSGMPQEFSGLIRRTPEWTFQLENVVPTQRKILLRLEAEIAQKYWTFSPSADKCYYLLAPPKPGLNDYVADAAGSVKQVEIPNNAEETRSSESKQTEFLLELSAIARSIPDDLQTQDSATWYSGWCAFLTRIQETTQLDSILQYVLMRDCAKLLASSDYFFQRRLEPILKMLNLPQLEEGASVDRFQTETQKLQKIRQLAKSRLDFLPKNHLVVDKTTAQLNAQVERVAFVYRRIGWLDLDFADEWKCRRPSDGELPEGDLYVSIPSDENEQLSQWFKIGSSNGKRTTLKLATNNVPRGSIVFCRVSLTQEKTIAKQASIERFFDR